MKWAIIYWLLPLACVAQIPVDPLPYTPLGPNPTQKVFPTTTWCATVTPTEIPGVKPNVTLSCTTYAPEPTVFARFNRIPRARGQARCWYDSYVDRIEIEKRTLNNQAEILKGVYECQDRCQQPLSNGKECKYAVYVKAGPRSKDLCLLDNLVYEPLAVNYRGPFDSWLCIGSEKMLPEIEDAPDTNEGEI
ncbi:uncharacterized protein CLUP02_11809 [Colletotrichum lupini]|uniref:Apple domain-containing protein n=2 Tax=Colletotrichum acutatum species complex TaxID=2707335 RepID=A0A9Q8SZ69_9PEZI|nr:uncharacterized protein CLUP02_11809 [Colletotrichum lupini]XP_060309293.1 uncharacterized protein CCOS01_12201 [Colletotrichum costaricense]KAK1517944.1 hypothetical protein CCOS01_12201 [Colletotrichum costaricense]KAK1704500.1 hypothetical protein BDP67DRAFT_623880 [Colletotrichum lupini]UQC86309.1 hypothetical protein CLUP02_11809 [Colletotrichum lupini]